MTPLLCEKYTVGTKAIVNNNGNTIKDANFSNDPIDHSINHTNRAVLDPEKQDKNITSSNHGLNKLLVLENTYIDSKKYIKLIRMGPSPRYQLIRNDSFRTFHASSTLPSPFWDKVPEQVLVRICNSCDHHIGPTCNILYCQGMNVLAGVLLYVMPEIHAFNIYTILCSRLLPLYWKSSHIGVEAGCVLVDSLLEILDPELFHHFTSQEPKLQALIYAFPIIKTLCASIQPLQEAVLLWDFILSMGPYITVLCATAHILLIRDDLLQSQYPKHLLDPRRSSRLRSQSIVSLVMSLIPLIPQDLFDILELHTTSPKVVEHITGRAVYGTSIKEPTNN